MFSGNLMHHRAAEAFKFLDNRSFSRAWRAGDYLPFCLLHERLLNA
jgi:hypothetical protein